MPLDAAEARRRVLSFLRSLGGAVAAIEDADGRGAQLLERATGKMLALRWDALEDAVERATPVRPLPYLVLAFHDGRQLALADVGFAFAPSTQNTGPLPDLPPTFCFRDFGHLSHGIDGLLGEEGREKEALQGILVCIALLDGARAAGLDVAREERILEALLKRLEERGVKL